MSSITLDAVTLRPAAPSDRELLLSVYSSTRETELAQLPWSAADKRAFLLFQFEAQHAHYHQHFAEADYSIIMAHDQPAGRLYVDRRRDEIRLIDIALLPAYRGAGIGTALLHRLIAEAHAVHKPLRIHVEQNNRALRLYERLGFTPLDRTGIYTLMECRPTAVR